MQIGRDKADNHRLLLIAEPNDWWVHASNFSSAHGWIKSERFPRVENATKTLHGAVGPLMTAS